MDVPVDPVEVPVDSVDVPVDSVLVSVDSVDVPVDSVDVLVGSPVDVPGSPEDVPVASLVTTGPVESGLVVDPSSVVDVLAGPVSLELSTAPSKSGLGSWHAAAASNHGPAHAHAIHRCRSRRSSRIRSTPLCAAQNRPRTPQGTIDTSVGVRLACLRDHSRRPTPPPATTTPVTVSPMPPPSVS